MTSTLQARLPRLITELCEFVRGVDLLKDQHRFPDAALFLPSRPGSALTHTPVPTRPLSREQDLHRLTTILLTMLVQLCHIRRFLEQGDATVQSRSPAPSSQWLRVTLAALGKLSEGLTPLLVTLVCGPPRLPAATANTFRADTSVELYAVLHFHGRLTPGCCYSRCTNMSGASEAALKTLLCSGCRWARYCSVGCQRAAWVEEGHSKVCNVSRSLM